MHGYQDMKYCLKIALIIHSMEFYLAIGVTELQFNTECYMQYMELWGNWIKFRFLDRGHFALSLSGDLILSIWNHREVNQQQAVKAV